MWRKILLAAALCLGTSVVSAQTYVVRPLALPAPGAHFAVDESGQRVFVTLPVENRVAEVSLVGGMSVLRQIPAGFRPARAALSTDGRYLYTTLGTSGSFTRYDRETGAPAEETVIASLLDHASTYDIVAGIGSEVFVSANPGSGGFAYIVRVDMASGDAERVASNRIIRAAPVFEIDRAAAFLYVGEGFSPNSVYKLDVSIPTAPIVGEDVHGSISGANSLSLNPSGTRLITAAGQVLRTSDLTQAAALGGGIGAYRPDGSVVATYSSSSIARFDAATLDSLPAISTAGCGFTSAIQFKALRRGSGWLLLGSGGTSLCKVEDADFVFASEFD